MAIVLKFKQLNTPRQAGELARLRVLKGLEVGSVYVLCAPQVSLGRGEEAHLVVADVKASRIHAELVSESEGWRIVDRQSANGTLHNGSPVQSAFLKLHDTITIGETVLEFLPSELGTMILTAPVRADLLKKKSTPKLNLRFIFLLFLIAMIFLLVPSQYQKKNKEPKKNPENTLSSGMQLEEYLPKLKKNKTAEALFKDGLREYFDGNYTRAKLQFETVLQISPTHLLAKIYLENTNTAIEEKTKLHLSFGKKAFESGKLREAKAHFDRVMLLLFKNQAHPDYIQAKEQYDKLKAQVQQESLE